MVPRSLQMPFNVPEAEDDSRLKVVAAARSWLGTPYHHAADVRGHGVDCAMLLVRVFCDLRLVELFDPRPYTADWFLHRDEERYMDHLLARAREVAEPLLGDVVLFKVGRCFAHGGIVSSDNPLRIVHAFAPARCVVEDDLRRCSELTAKPFKYFSYWQVAQPRVTEFGS
jgi:cell wall-associated NlpC family hydrolase